MVLITGNWRTAIIGGIVSLVIFAVVYFAVISPAQDTANQALKTGLSQAQQAINQAQKQASTAAGQTPTVPSTVTNQAQQVLSKAAKLTACIQAAGTDAGKIQACQVQFGG